MGRIVYLNGQFVPESEATLSIYDLSVMQAAAAFEMTRSFNGVHFKLREHIERLETSCIKLRMGFPISPTGFVKETLELCEEVSSRNDHGPGEEHRLLIVVSPGCAPMYKDLEGVIPHPFLSIADFPLSITTRGMGQYFRDGVELSWSPIRQIPSVCIPSQAKHRGRLAFHLAQVQATPQTWPIMLDVSETYVTECPGANLIIVKQNRIYCANYEALPGISQQTVADLMASMGYVVIWGPVTMDQLAQADEVWISGTPFCAVPASHLGDTWFDRTIYAKLLRAWSDLVGVRIDEQIGAWDGTRELETQRSA